MSRVDMQEKAYEQAFAEIRDRLTIAELFEIDAVWFAVEKEYADEIAELEREILASMIASDV